jgi:hypothetical protein
VQISKDKVIKDANPYFILRSLRSFVTLSEAKKKEEEEKKRKRE